MALVADYGFDEGTGTTSAASTTGPTFNVTGTWTTGHTGNAITATSGSAGNVTPFTSAAPSWTVMGWFKWSTFGTAYSSAIEVGDAGALPSIFFEASQAGAVDFYARLNGQSCEADGPTLTVGTWYHLAATFDNSTHTITGYVNGTSIGSSTMPGTGTFSLVGTEFLIAGGTSNPGSNITADDLRFFDTVLSATEIGTYMDIPVGGSSTTRITKTADLDWNVEGSITRITKTASADWNVRFRIVKTSGLNWNVFGNFLWPTTVSGQQILDQNGDPYVIMGDSPWSLAVQVSSTDANTYIDQVAAAGRNAMIVNSLVIDGGNADSATYDGVDPFTSWTDWTDPNEDYWTRVDNVIDHAASQGITVFLNWAFTQKDNNDALGVLADQSSSNWTTFGTFLGNRYKDKPNLVWVWGGDWAPSYWSTLSACVKAVHDAIRSTGDTHLTTGENYQDSISSDNTTMADYVDLEWAYTYQALYKLGKTSAKPIFIGETEYEDENNGNGPATTAATLRHQVGWAYSQGYQGDFAGTNYWDLHSGWSGSIDSTAMQQIQAMRDAVKDLDLASLNPTSDLITSGTGTDPSSGTMDGNQVDPLESTYATAAISPDKSLAIIYLPASRAMTVDLDQLGSDPTFTAIDPTTGTATTPTTLSATISAPGNNASGDSDWLYILQATPVTTSRVTKTAGSGWNVNSRPVKTTSSTWTTRARQTKTSDIDWNIRVRINKTTDGRWETLTRLTKASGIDWTVASSITRVTRTGPAGWNVRDRVTTTSALRWNTDSTQVARDLKILGTTVPVTHWGTNGPVISWKTGTPTLQHPHTVTAPNTAWTTTQPNN